MLVDSNGCCTGLVHGTSSGWCLQSNVGYDFTGVFVTAVGAVGSGLGVARQLVQQLGLLVLFSLGTTQV